MKKALWRLSTGDMTSQEMLLYLTDSHRKTYFSQEVAERCVCLLVQEGFLDDKRYLKDLVRRLDAKGFGPRRLRQELCRHRFPQRFVDAAVSRDLDYTARAARVLAAKAGADELAKTPAGRKKLSDALVRYGYDYSTASAAIARFSREDFSD